MDRTILDGNSNEVFKGALKNRFSDLFWQLLSLLEVAFPHEKGDGSENEKAFLTIRSKILRIGNDSLRDLEPWLESYVVFQLYEYKRKEVPSIEKVIFDFKNNYTINKKGEDNGKNGKDSRN